MDRSRFGRAASAFGAVLAQDPAFAPASHNIGVVLHALVLRTWLGLVLGGVALAVVRAAVHPWGAGEAVVAFSLAVLVLGAVCALILVPLRGVSVGTRSYVRSRVRRGALAFTAWTSVLAGVCLPVAVLLPPHPAVGAFPVAGGAAMVGLGALLFDMMCATSASGRAMRLPRGRTDHLRNGVAFVAVNAVAYAAWYLVVR